MIEDWCAKNLAKREGVIQEKESEGTINGSGEKKRSTRGFSPSTEEKEPSSGER